MHSDLFFSFKPRDWLTCLSLLIFIPHRLCRRLVKPCWGCRLSWLFLSGKVCGLPSTEAQRTQRRRCRTRGWWSSVQDSASGGSLWLWHLGGWKTHTYTFSISACQKIVNSVQFCPHSRCNLHKDTNTTWWRQRYSTYQSEIGDNCEVLKCLTQLLATWLLLVCSIQALKHRKKTRDSETRETKP